MRKNVSQTLAPTLHFNLSPHVVSLTYVVACMLGLLLSSGVFAQTFPPPSSCTSKDLELISATLPPPANQPCQCSGTRTLVLGIRNKTGSTRTSFALWGTLKRYNASGVLTESSAIFACAGPIVKNSDNFLPATSGNINITVNCGETLEIVDLYLAWTSANNNETCPTLENSPSTINPKCGTLPKITIGTGVNAGFDITNATCTANGSIQVSPNGGVAPYKVKIGTDERTSIAAGGSTTFSLPAGTYSILVTDSRNCPVTLSREILGSANPSVSGIGGDFTKTCTGNPNGAQIGETAQAGHTYAWTSNPSGFTSSVANPTVNPSVSTTYTVTKTSTATGCSAQATVNVTVNTSSPNVSGVGGGFTKTCTENTDGSAIGEVAQAGHSYSWTSDPAGFTSTDANPTVNPSASTTYTVRKTNTSTGCYADANVNVTVNTTAPDVSGIGGAFTKTCTSHTSGAAIGETAQAGHSYSWTSSPAGFTNSNANPTVNPSVTTIYTVRKTNTTTGCYADASVTVTVNTTTPDVSGIGGAFTKTCTQNTGGGAIGETAQSGHSYSWTSDPVGFTSSDANPTVNPNATTTYTVRKTNTANGCYADATVTVTVNTAAAQFSVCLVQPSLCGNTGSVTFSASGGSGFEYSINNGTSYQGSNTFTNLGSGSVTGFKVRTSNGCVASNPCNTTSDCEPITQSSRQDAISEQSIELQSKRSQRVNAAPNPFRERIRFSLKSDVSGQGSLELYNMMGQKVKTVFQGQITAGQVQNIEYAVPYQQRTNLVYIFRVGSEMTSGKLIGIR